MTETVAEVGVVERRAFLKGLYSSLRLTRETPRSADLKNALEELVASCEPLYGYEGELHIRVLRHALYLNHVRVESDIENFVFYGHIHSVLHSAGIGAVEMTGKPSINDWGTFLALTIKEAGPTDDPTKTVRLQKGLASRSVKTIEVHPPIAGGADLPGEEARVAAARETYEKSVEISRDLFTGTRMGRAANTKQVRSAVQGIVDAVLNNEGSLGGLSILSEYDDYAFTHAVNVCIFCVAIGKRLGLSKRQLYDLGLAALVHDIGMSRVPVRILAKGEKLSDEEQALMEAHTWMGALSIFELRDAHHIPYQGMIAAYEHHMREAGDYGYPKPIRPRKTSVFSKIIAVASAFDAATNERSYSKAKAPDQVLREFWEDEESGFDPVIVKALINLLGIYPVGTVVILDTYELAIVHTANPDMAYVHRPVVRLLCDADGHWLEPAPLIDLAETGDDGHFIRTIIKVTRPDRYGINVADYFE